MKLLLADDHNLFRDALVEYIGRAEPDAAVRLAGSMNEVMALMQKDPDIDLVLLDLYMPGMNGLKGLEILRRAHPGVPVALLSGLAEKEDVERALALGAAGYFPKTLSGKAMMEGIRQILDGKTYVARDDGTNEIMPSHYGDVSRGNGLDRLANAGGNDNNNNIRLTPREREVLAFLLRGESNKEIARALDLQVVTVKLHVRGICRKLGARNRTQAALIARERRL